MPNDPLQLTFKGKLVYISLGVQIYIYDYHLVSFEELGLGYDSRIGPSRYSDRELVRRYKSLARRKRSRRLFSMSLEVHVSGRCNGILIEAKLKCSYYIHA